MRSRFKIVPANDASGDLAVESPNDSGKGVGHAVYEVDIPQHGAYRLMARVWWEDGCSNSLGIQVSGQPQVVLADEIFNRWHNIEAAQPVKLKAGKCKITLVPVEDGIKIDHFSLVPVK